MRRLTKKLARNVPADVKRVDLRVGDVPGFLNDAGIYASTVPGVSYEGVTAKGLEFHGYVRCRPFPWTFADHKRAEDVALEAWAYLSARGIEARVRGICI